MSWASISAEVFDSRARLPSPVGDTYASASVLEALWASILHPGSIWASNGWFGVRDLGAAPSGLPLGSAGHYLDGIRFYLPPGAIPQAASHVIRQAYGRDDAWFRQARPNRVNMLAAPPVGLSLSTAYSHTLASVQALLADTFSRISWIPQDLRQRWIGAIAAGAMPQLLSSGFLLDNAIVPSFIRTEAQMAAWDSLASDLNALTKTYLAGQMEDLRSEAERIYANTAFWDRVAVYSGVDAINKAWDELKGAVRGFNTATTLALENLDTIDRMIADAPGVYSAAQVSSAQHLRADVTTNVQSMRNTVAPFEVALRMDDVTMVQGTLQGLGALPLSVLVIGGVAAAIAAAAAAAVLLHNSQVKATKASNDLMASMLSTREAYDMAAHQAKAQQIAQAKAQYDAMFAAGSLSANDYQRLTGDLQAQARDNDIQLERNRQQNIKEIETYNKVLKTAQDTGLDTITGGIRGTAAWMAIGAVAVASVFVVPPLLKARR